MNVTLRLALAAGAAADRHVIDVDAPVGTSFGDLRANVDDTLLDELLAADATPITDDSVFGTPPLIDGAFIEPRRGRGDLAGTSPLRMVVDVGPAQGRACSLAPGEHFLDRSHPLLQDDSLVSRQHARVTMTRGGVQVSDEGSSNGTRLDGRLLLPHEPAIWRVGQHVRIGATTIRLDTLPEPAELTADGRGRVLSMSVPTRAQLTSPQQIQWPERPPQPNRSPMRWVAALVPVPVALIMAVVMHSALMLAFMFIGPLTIGLTHLDDRRRGKTSSRAALKQFVADRADTTRRINALLEEERLTRGGRLPPPDVLTDIAAGRRAGLGLNTQGWPLELRLGHGTSASIHSITADGSARQITLDDAPVSVILKQGDVLHAEAGEEHIDAFVEQIVAQLLVRGVPHAAGLLVISPSCHGERWVWCRDTAGLEVAEDIPEDLVRDLDERAGRPGQAENDLPLIVADARCRAGRELLRRWGTVDSGALIWVGPAAPELRREARAGTSARRVHTAHLEVGHDASLTSDGHRFTLDHPPSSWFSTTTRLMRRWAVDSRSGGQATLPVTVPAHELLPNDLGNAWRAGPCSAIPIGRSLSGVACLDLVRSGPHSLVAGTTGAGKSEFLLAYLRGLFTLNGPQDVTALLIDYKGGATFGALMRAPHVVGVVTDLDDGLAARALIALQAEIKFREHFLAERGFSSYTAYRAAMTDNSPLPRLFVVVDEFRVLSEELPEFVAGLVRLAAVGRSLGMHLVLATQRPGGAVTADMRANLDVRIALRVRERSDSLDVIDSPAAAKISPRRPGRAFIAHGGVTPFEVQTSFTGAPRSVHTQLPRPHFHAVEQHAGAPPLTCPGCQSDVTETTTDLQEFVHEALEAARDIPRPRRPLLPPLPDTITIDNHADVRRLTWSDLLTPLPRVSTAPNSDAPAIAVADLPHDQSQPAVTCEGSHHIGLAGAPRSGRTHAAARIAATRRTNRDEVWWVGQAPRLPVDEWFDAEDPNDVVRLLSTLSDADTPANSSGVTVVIDGWEALHDNLLRINHGLGAEEMLRHIQRGHQARRVFVITGGRLVLASKLAALLEVKIVLHQNDQTEYSLAGLRPAQVPTQMPPGRGLVLPYAHVVQFAACRNEAM